MYQQFNLLFYKGNGLIDRLIKEVSHGSYSHCAMFLDQFHTLETSWNSPSVIRHFDYKKGEYDIYKLNIELTEQQKQIISEYIVEHVENGYDFLYLLSRGLHLIFGTKIYNSPKYYTCDELIVDAFKEVGINLHEVDADLSPSTLANSKYLNKIT